MRIELRRDHGRGESPVFFKTKGRKRREVGSLLTKILNHNCSEVNNAADGPRTEDRVNLTRAVRIVPYVNGRLVMDASFATVTKELSTSGISVVLKYPVGFDEAVVGVNWEGTMTFIHSFVRHQDPLGAGLWHLGLEFDEIVPAEKYPQLKELRI
jgi:hypothetical protein